MRSLFGLLLLINSTFAWSQLSLDSAISQAYRHYQFDLESSGLTESGNLSVKNAGNSWYPTLNFDYSSTYQNQQIEFSAPPIPGQDVKTVPLDFHRALINFNQNIYDGSMAAHKKSIERANAQNQQYQLSLEKIKLRSYIVQLFMGILLVDQNKKIVQSKKAVLEKQLSRVQSAVQNGLAQNADQKIMEAELLGIKQTETDLGGRKASMLKQLSIQMGIELDDKTNLLMPQVEMNPTKMEERPDILLIQNQIKLLDTKKKLTTSSRLPNIRVFGSAGLGNPGYNILDNTIQPMGLVGIGVRWTIWDWKAAGNDRKKLTIQQQTLEYNLNRQKLQLNSQLAQQSEEINRLEEVMIDDEDIISLRKEVLEIKAAQLENGVITSSDFIVELNNSNMAELNKSIHNLEWIQAKINYNIIAGN